MPCYRPLKEDPTDEARSADPDHAGRHGRPGSRVLPRLPVSWPNCRRSRLRAASSIEELARPASLTNRLRTACSVKSAFATWLAGSERRAWARSRRPELAESGPAGLGRPERTPCPAWLRHLADPGNHGGKRKAARLFGRARGANVRPRPPRLALRLLAGSPRPEPSGFPGGGRCRRASPRRYTAWTARSSSFPPRGTGRVIG
jgi:hypothetical protein